MSSRLMCMQPTTPSNSHKKTQIVHKAWHSSVIKWLGIFIRRTHQTYWCIVLKINCTWDRHHELIVHMSSSATPSHFLSLWYVPKQTQHSSSLIRINNSHAFLGCWLPYRICCLPLFRFAFSADLLAYSSPFLAFFICLFLDLILPLLFPFSFASFHLYCQIPFLIHFALMDG